MTHRERLLLLLEGRKPDKLPWIADLAYWHFGMKAQGKLDGRYKGYEGIIQLHKDLNVGFYQQSHHPYAAKYKNCEVTEVERQTGEYDEFRSPYFGNKIIENKTNNDVIREIITPIGTIHDHWIYSRITYSWAPREYFVKTVDDLKILKYWFEHAEYEPDYERASWEKDIIGDQGCVTCEMPRSPFMQLFVDYIGLETIINFVFGGEVKLFVETLKSLENIADEAAKITLESPAELIMQTENLSSDMVGHFYAEYAKTFEVKWNEKIKKAGKYSFCHFDGYLKGLLKDVATAGYSVIEAMTPKPVGDLNVSEFKDYVTTDSIMCGGLPGPIFSKLEMDEDQFKDFVKNTIRIWTSEPRYILDTADQVPPGAEIERVKVVSDLVEEYGSYITK